MPTTFLYSTSAELTEIAQDKLPALQQNRVIFDIMPIETTDASVIIWEQKDNYIGLQQLRGINGAFPLISQPGSKQYVERPGYYGEGSMIDEIQLTERRQVGTFADPVSIDDLVMERQDFLLGRRLDRIEWIGWQLLQYGAFYVTTPNGTLAHQGAYSIQTYSAIVPWSTAATATPLADLRAIKLLGRGHSVNLGNQAKAYANTKTINSLLANTNGTDIYGRRTAGLGTFNNLGEVNTLLTGDGLANLVEYDDGYLNDAGQFVPFIADGKVIVIGKRPAGQPVSKYKMTRNANHPTLAPGDFMWVKDMRGEEGEGDAPTITVFDSHNGGPIIEYPSSVVVMNV